MAGGQRMIQVNWNGSQVCVNPDPAVVNVGDVVRWVLSHGGAAPECTVYFAHGSPFPETEVRFSDISAPVVPTQEGDWKYGVRVEQGGVRLADDDPRLLVQR